MEENKIPPPPPSQEKSASNAQDNQNSTISSTTLSTEQLICKTPNPDLKDSNEKAYQKHNRRKSSCISVPTMKSQNDLIAQSVNEKSGPRINALLILNMLQILFGISMSVFGVLVIVHDGSLAQIGGGLWGGCAALAAGICGAIAAAETFCPLRSTAQKFAQTVALVLSLISLAISQLVLVIAATGIIRDVSKMEMEQEQMIVEDQIAEVLPSNYPGLLSNIGLLLVSAAEFFVAAATCYKGARTICPCFKGKSDEENFESNLRRHALVNSWLGKHAHGPPVLLVPAPAAPGSLRSSSKLSTMTPVMVPAPMLHPPTQVLIPAPMGTIPAPFIHPYHQHMPMKRYKIPVQYPTEMKKAKAKKTEPQLTEEDVVRTYTGLDRAIAEEFIEICESRQNSLCSSAESATTSSSCSKNCNKNCEMCNSELGSRDYLINK